MSLTDTTIKNAKPKNTVYKIAEEKGLYLFVTKNGNKYFRLDYRFLGKRKTLALGVYPETSLKEARKLLSDNLDPLEAKRSRSFCLLLRPIIALKTLPLNGIKNENQMVY